MIGWQGPLVLVPAEYSGHAKLVGCPWCMAALMAVIGEDGRAGWPLDVHAWDLAGDPDCFQTPVKGGWAIATRHLCARSVGAFASPYVHKIC